MKKADRNVSLTSIIWKPDPKISLCEGKRRGVIREALVVFHTKTFFYLVSFQFLFSFKCLHPFKVSHINQCNNFFRFLHPNHSSYLISSAYQFIIQLDE